MSSEIVIFGLHAVQSLLQRQPKNVLELWVSASRNDARIGEVIALAEQNRLPIRQLDRDALDKRSGNGRHQGVIALCKQAPSYHEKELLDLLDALEEPPFLLVLDGVTDPHNLGACLRSADGAGVDAVIAPKDKAVGLNATVRKVACGAAEHVPFIQVTNLARTLRQLQERGIWLVGTAGEAEHSIYESNFKGPLAIIMGSEGKGMRRLTREHCDALVKIPLLGSVESLNVSVATAVTLYEALRQRHPS
jgi:23S rRNA (guanosine2251-2'-O)-methyltransferase